jgi:hypothetical protein
VLLGFFIARPQLAQFLDDPRRAPVATASRAA